MSKEIGGFIELELQKNKHFHKNAILLNSARNALRYVIRAYNIQKIHVPYYTCPVVWDAIKAESCKIIPYQINEHFMPKVEFDENDFILYTNYFGICAKQIKNLAKIYKNLIIDNAMSFFTPHFGLASFYSPRKFFGVADGGILLCDKKLDEKFAKDTSYQRFSHLIKRVDINSNFAYEDFRHSEDSLDDEPIKEMSNLSEKLLCACNYKRAKRKRVRNFNLLAKELNSVNLLKTKKLDELDVPSHYPLMLKNTDKIYKILLENKIYCPRFWPGTIDLMKGSKCEIERNFCNNLIPLIIDQRYGKTQLKKIISVIQKALKG